MFLISSVACHASNEEKPFSEFWAKFREASLAEDYSSLKKLVKFPLEVRGVDDEIPAEFYAQDKIAEVFPQLLAQTVYNYEQDDLEGKPLKELIQKKTVVNVEPGKVNHRVEQFEFQKIEGQWLLVRAYLE